MLPDAAGSALRDLDNPSPNRRGEGQPSATSQGAGCAAISSTRAFSLAIQELERPEATAGTGHIMNLLTTLLLIAMLATLGALAVGLAGFFHGGEFNRKYGNKLMQARVALQAVAVLLLLMLLLGVGRS
jgi:hypothetical protein